jgi:hypothetical protein
LGSNNLEATDGWLATTAETKSVTALQRQIYLPLSGAKEFRPNAAEDTIKLQIQELSTPNYSPKSQVEIAVLLAEHLGRPSPPFYTAAQVLGCLEGTEIPHHLQIDKC